MGTQAAQSPDPPSTPLTTPPPDAAAAVAQQELPVVESTPVATQTSAPPPPPPPPGKPTEDASAALAAEKARVQSLISRIVTNAHASTEPAVAPSAKDTASQNSSSQSQKKKKKQGHFEWSETATAASLVYRVPADTRTAHVAVTFAPDSLALAVTPADPSLAFSLSRALRGRAIVDSCWWALEDRSDGSRVLLVELEKTVPGMWGGVFDGEDQDAVERPDVSNDAASDDAPDADTNDTERPSSGDEAGAGAEHSEEDAQSIDDAVGSFVDSMINNVSDSVDNRTGAPAAEPTTEVEDVAEELDASSAANQSRSTAEAAAATDVTGSSAAPGASDAQGRKVLTKADLPKLIDQHRAAVAARGPGWGDAAVQLGTLYHYAIGVERDDGEAARLYRLGLENGAEDASAAFQLGLIYNQGDGANLRPDAAQAVKWWTVSAKLGNAVAMFNLGVLCMNGSGCDMDPVAAMTWFQKARELNPKLEIPQLSPAQLEQRVTMARRVRKERRWAAMPEEERERRRKEAFDNLKLAMTASVGVAAVTVGAVLIRNWWRNRL